jgi:hypothetical protein
MANLRIVTTNLVDTATTVSASSTATGSSASYLTTEYKSQAHRSQGTTVTYTINWSGTGVSQSINCIVLPCTNLTKTATIAVTVGGYSMSAVTACPNTTIADFTTPNVNTFAYGGYSKTAVWLPNTQTVSTAQNVTITLTDASNPAGYIDCSRIVCGLYWQPTYNASKNNLSISVLDSTQVQRTDAGDLIAERGFVYEQLQFSLDILTDADRDRLLAVTKSLGTYKNFTTCIFPDSSATANTANEQAFLIYGKRDNAPLNYILPGFSSHSMQITGW